MRAGLAALTANMRRLERALFRPQTRVFCVSAGGDLTPEQQASIQPGDRVIIEEIIPGYLEGPPCNSHDLANS